MIRVIGKIDLEFTLEEARELYGELGNMTNKEFQDRPRLHEIYLLLNSKFDPADDE